jgi:hypothetical protein
MSTDKGDFQAKKRKKSSPKKILKKIKKFFKKVLHFEKKCDIIIKL